MNPQPPSMTVNLHPGTAMSVRLVTDQARPRLVLSLGAWPTEVDVFLNPEELAHLLDLLTRAEHHLCQISCTPRSGVAS